MIAESIAEPLPSGPSDAAFARLPEALIHRAWADGLFATGALATTDGEPVRILRPGRLNRDSGPDFLDARVEIGGTTWAGAVEIHRTSAEWDAHGHDADPCYDGVVLHVVLSPDRRTGTLRRADGSALPELVLLPHLDRSLRALVHDLSAAPRDAPFCAARWSELRTDVVADWLAACAAGRLRLQTARLARAYTRLPDLDLLLARRVFRALGYEANADAMERLAGRLPWGALPDAPDDVLALVAGTAGWLAPGLFPDPVVARWEAVGRGIRPMDRASWHAGGRPANRPRVRLAQAAALAAGPLRADAVPTLAAALARGVDAAVDALRLPTADGTPPLGLDRARAVLVNAALPVLALGAELRAAAALAEAVEAAPAALPAVADHVTRGFSDAGATIRTMRDAHGAHHLARTFCDEGRCARCVIGRTLYPALVA